MVFEPTRIAVVGATGPTGIHLARELVQRGRQVRVVSRDRERLRTSFTGLEVEIAPADALAADPLAAAIAGCELVVDCIGLPPEQMSLHPAAARTIVAAAGRVGARCLQISSYWAFLPSDKGVLSESSPREGDHPWYRPRREAEDVFLAAGASVVHLPDFFGPDVHTSSVQMALEDAVAGRPVRCIGGAATEREAGYVLDLMRMVATLSEHDEAYGTDWALPGAGPLSPARLAQIAGEHLGRRVRVQAAPPWMLRLLALFSREVRGILPMVGHYSRPVRYDTGKLRKLLGPPQPTPFEVSIPATLDWLRQVR